MRIGSPRARTTPSSARACPAISAILAPARVSSTSASVSRLGRARVPVSLERERVPHGGSRAVPLPGNTRDRVSEPVKLTPAIDDARVARARGEPRRRVRVRPCAPPALQSHITSVPVVLSCRRRFERGKDVDADTSIRGVSQKLASSVSTPRAFHSPASRAKSPPPMTCRRRIARDAELWVANPEFSR